MVEIKQVRLGESAIPPELLVARRRQQLAGQLTATYEQEQKTQLQRQATEQARATADQQKDLVTAQISVQVAKQNLEKRTIDGNAERQFLEALAAGQSAQAKVLGEDKVAMLTALDKVLATLREKPELVQLMSKLVPNTYVSGGGGLDGAAAILTQAFSNSHADTPTGKASSK
jgi:hypothetical protein